MLPPQGRIQYVLTAKQQYSGIVPREAACTMPGPISGFGLTTLDRSESRGSDILDGIINADGALPADVLCVSSTFDLSQIVVDGVDGGGSSPHARRCGRVDLPAGPRAKPALNNKIIK